MDWVEVMQKVGFPVAMVAFFVWGSIHLARYIAINVIQPMLAAHLSLIGQLKEFVAHSQAMQDRQERWNDALLQESQLQSQLLREVHQDLREGRGCRATAGNKSNESPNRPT